MKAEKLLNVARQEIGVTEYPPNSNKVIYNTWYYGSPVSGDGYPWCMAFVQWCYCMSGISIPYKTASCSDLLEWYKAHQPERVMKDPMPGDVMILNGHTGIVEKRDGDYVITIEGNTSPSDSGSQYNGGCVARKRQAISKVVAFIRVVDFDREDALDRDKLLSALGDKYIARYDELPGWAKKDVRWMLDEGIINGGTSKAEDPDDVNMNLSDIKTAIICKRMVEKMLGK